MLDFNRELYLHEMQALIFQAKESLAIKDEEVAIFTINIWTDPDAAVSAVNVDTQQHSDRMIELQNQQAAVERERLLSVGDIDGAALWQDQAGRVCNPADFAYPIIAECQHRSFSAGWEQESEGQCWNVLEPALQEVGEWTRGMLDGLRLHPHAELSVNSRYDWYDHAWNIGISEKKPDMPL